MLKNRTYHLAFSTLILVAVATSHAPAFSQTTADPNEIIAPDAHTAAALKRAADNEGLEKISTEPTPAPSQETTGKESAVKVDAAPVADKKAESVKEETKPNEKHEEVKTEKVPEKIAVAPTGIPAETALKWLENGNTRYVKKHFRADGRTQADRDRTSKGAKPHAIILSCSDSRVSPELVFDQAIGEISVVRVAGEALDNSVIASIETAIKNEGPHLLVVMGHTRCETIEAALNSKENKESAGSEAMDKILDDIRPRLASVAGQRTENLEAESAVNADGVARDLVRRSSLIKAKVESGELVIKTALYWLDSGQVKFY